MPTPRSMIVDEAVTPYYHCISRCVRRAFLCGNDGAHRKQWLEDRLKELVGIFAIDCAGFAVMDNHLHVLVRLDSVRAKSFSSEDVARRWLTLFPIRGLDGKPFPVSETQVHQLADDPVRVAKIRQRFSNLGWFMKCLKEPLAKLANKEDGCTGAFWEGRFKSVAVLDEESILATAAYIDLNPLAAGIAATPEESEHTSLRARLDHCQANDTLGTLHDGLSTQTRNRQQEKDVWLLPIDDHRDNGDTRPGLIAGCTLSCYLRLVDWTSRLLRQGKARIDAAIAPIFKRLRVDPIGWEVTLKQLFAREKRSGTHFGRPKSLAEAAQAHGQRWHRNQVPRLHPAYLE